MYRILAALAASLFVSASAWAAPGDWQVARASQQVTVTVDRKTWQPVRTGDIVPNNAWVQTGPKGRVQLVRGVESVTFQPNSLAGIFTAGSTETKTEIVQQVGVLDLEIEKRNQPHTTVQTPFLAAVVKGTNFRVSVSRQTAAVAVNRGLVQVTSFQTGQRSSLGPGQKASVDTNKGMTVSGVTSVPAVTTVAPSSARVPAVGRSSVVGASSRQSSTKTSANGPSLGPSAEKGSLGASVSGSNGNQASSSDSGRNGANGDRNGHGENGNGNGPGSDQGNGNGNSGGGGNGTAGGNGQGNNGNGNGNGGGNGTGNEGNGNGQGNSGNGGGNGNGSGRGN